MRRRFTVLMAAALAAIPALVLVGGAGSAGAVDVGDEATFRTAWDTATEVTLTADITLTCVGGGAAERDSDDPVVLEGAGHTIALEVGCVDRVLQNNGQGNATLRNVTITGGVTSGDGAGYEHNGSGSLTIENSAIVDNVGCSEGGGIEIEDPTSVVIRSSTLSGNFSNNDAAINLDSDGGSLVIVDSTITGNRAAEGGAVHVDAETVVSLVYSTIVGNEETTDTCVVSDGLAPSDADPVADPAEAEDDPAVAPLEAGEPANLSAGDGTIVTSFGTVIANPIGNGTPTPNCDLEEAMSSLGYNFSDDGTCGFTNVGTGDRESAGSPGVGALASNGGPTQTMLPNNASPLLDWIPLAACGGGNELAGFPVTTDQRGVGRPQGPGCDVGAVEVEFVLSFTG